jgi:hypothetical protein
MLAQRQMGYNPHRARIDALLDQARVAAADQRYDDAIGFVEGAVQLDRADPDLVCLLASYHREAGDFGSASRLEDECAELRASLDVAEQPELP